MKNEKHMNLNKHDMYGGVPIEFVEHQHMAILSYIQCVGKQTWAKAICL